MQDYTLPKEQIGNIWQKIAAERNPDSQTAQTFRNNKLETQQELVNRRLNKGRKGAQSVMVIDPAEAEPVEPVAVQPYTGTDANEFFASAQAISDELSAAVIGYNARPTGPDPRLVELRNELNTLRQRIAVIEDEIADIEAKGTREEQLRAAVETAQTKLTGVAGAAKLLIENQIQMERFGRVIPFSNRPQSLKDDLALHARVLSGLNAKSAFFTALGDRVSESVLKVRAEAVLKRIAQLVEYVRKDQEKHAAKI